MSIDAKLIVDAMSKLFDELVAGLFKQDVAREASRSVPIPTQYATIEADVVADNWGGLFDGGDDSVELGQTGLFEQLVHFQEELNLEFLDMPSCFAPAPTASTAVFLVDAGQDLVKYSVVDDKYIPTSDASASLTASAASYDTAAPAPSTANLAADFIHYGSADTELVTAPIAPPAEADAGPEVPLAAREPSTAACAAGIAPPIFIGIHTLSAGFTLASPSVEKVAINNSPSRCSMQVHTSETTFLSSDSRYVVSVDTWLQCTVSAVLGRHCWICHDEVLSLTIIQCYEWDVKLQLHWKYTMLPDCCDYEAGIVSDQPMIVVLLHDFPQLKYYMVNHHGVIPNAMITTSLIERLQCGNNLLLFSYWALLLLRSRFMDAQFSINIGQAVQVPLQFSVRQINSQVSGMLSQMLIVECLFTSKIHLLAVSIMEINTKYVTSIRHLQVPWDPGGFSVSYRLGGKPDFKKGRMLGMCKWIQRRNTGLQLYCDRAQATEQKAQYEVQWKWVVLVPACTHSGPAHVLALYRILGVRRGE